MISRPLSVLACAISVGGALITGTSPASAQVDLFATYGGLHGYGTECLSHNDDGSSALIDLTPFFPSGLQFFDENHTAVYVNTNGNLTFSGPLPTYTPRAFPVAEEPMIAPYWADVDIRTMFGDCWGGDATAEPGDEACEDPPENGVWWHLEAGRMVVTWDRVGYYDCNDDKRMSFQLILTAVDGCGGAGDFDVEFRFNRCEWATGDASGGSDGFGGTEAQVGFDAGNGVDYVEVPGSRTDEIHDIVCTGSNVDDPGIWRFRIRSGAILCPDAGTPCETGDPGICSNGAIQCTGADLSEVVCAPLIAASDERCDALDNDCDGETDEGEGLCEAFQVCERGHCVNRCSEFGCGAGEICGTDGLCIEEACLGVECDPGLRCVGGNCVGACDGVVCPRGQTCSGGNCIDLCATMTCDECTVCVEGLCELRCQWAGCAEGETCTDSGLCVESGCVDVDCPAGTFCSEGSCVDACEGALCPSGEVCEGGLCVPAAVDRPDGGPATPDGGLPDGGPSVDGGVDGGDAGPDGGAPGDDDAPCTGSRCSEPGGCSCRASSSLRAGSGVTLVTILIVALLPLFRHRKSS